MKTQVPVRPPVTTIILILITTAVFLFELTLDGRELAIFFDRWAMVPVQLVQSLASGNSAGAEAATVFTSLFIHGGWTHLLGNLLYLWIFGDQCESLLGHIGVAVLYLASGIIASLAQMLIEPFSPIAIVGASGAVSGLMGAYVGLIRPLKYQTNNSNHQSIRLFFFSRTEQPVILVLTVWFIWQFFNGIAQIGSIQSQNGGVAFFAHVGGFIAGLAFARLLPTAST